MRALDHADGETLDGLLARGEFFWLDLLDPPRAQLAELAARLGWHPLALEDAEEFGQRPKLDDYADHALLVFYGMHEAAGGLTEVHLFISGGWVVTVRRRACRPLADALARAAAEPPRSEEQLVYRILDALTDAFFPFLGDVDDQLDALEDAIIADPRPELLGEVLRLRRTIGPARRVAIAQRDLFGNVRGLIERMPGLERDEAGEAFRDVADHLARIAETLESYRDRVAGALELYATTNGNRLNEATERLTVVATIFLPLTFVVGFFGQNFGWLTSRIDSLNTFLIYGVGGLVVPVVLLLAVFRRAGFLGRR